MNFNGLHRETTTYERPIYGSSRLGIMNKAVVFNMNGGLLSKSNSTIGIKEYELSDHLGNVSVIVLDRKNALSTDIQPIIISNTDYYPFGYPISFRTHSTGYRYGFNGKEYDNEIYNASNFQDYGMRMYDTRIARFWGVDPLKSDYPMLSPFQFASNSPIWAIDMDGLEAYIVNGKFDRWGQIQGADAPVIIIKKAGDVNGITLKNNSKDYYGKNITVAQFYKRVERIWAEGGKSSISAPYYAHGQDNKRKATGGNENDNYSYMKYPNFDTNSSFDPYIDFNNARGKGYNNLLGLNELAGVDQAVIAEINLLLGKSNDPTKGATQWRGHDVKSTVELNGENVSWKEYWEYTMEKGKTDASILEDYKLNNSYVKDYIIFENNGRYHLFFSIQKTKNETKTQTQK